MCVFCLSLIDAQIDVQNVPVDTTKEHHYIRVLLTFQSGCVPDRGIGSRPWAPFFPNENSVLQKSYTSMWFPEIPSDSDAFVKACVTEV